jgi:hypothetical protein
MNNEIAFIRAEIDRQVRPGQGGAATEGQRVPAWGSVVGGQNAACVLQRAGGAQVTALYGRAKYGGQRYAG